MSDDGFIGFRYVQNALAGHGFVYNPGERVEGYTNFLWVALLAAGARLGASPESLAIPLSMVFTAGLWAAVARLAIDTSPTRSRSVAVVLPLGWLAAHVGAEGGRGELEVAWGACSTKWCSSGSRPKRHRKL